jgi:hypothetical protein
MERRCSWAEFQILSAEACILVSPTTRFMGILFTWLQIDFPGGFPVSLLTPKSGCASKFLEPLVLLTITTMMRTCLNY